MKTREDDVKAYETSLARMKQEHEKKMAIYDALEGLNLGPYFKGVGTYGYCTSGTIHFSGVPTKEEVVRIYHLLPPVEPFFKYSDSCTSFRPEKALKASEYERMKEGTAKGELIAPYVVRTNKNFGHGAPFDIKMEWYTELAGKFYHVDVELPWKHWRNAIRITASKKEMGWGANKWYKSVWDIYNSFGSPYRVVKWAAGTDGDMNPFTIYFIDPEEDIVATLDPIVNTDLPEDNDENG